MFGLSEAPRLWWLRIRKDLVETGWEELSVMAAVFIIKDPAGKLCGILVLHVDDGLTCGRGKHYTAALEALKKRAPLNK